MKHQDPRGSSLVELLIALPIAALLLAAAATTLVTAWRLLRHSQAAQLQSREFRHALSAVEADLRSLRAEDLDIVSDSVVAFQSVLGAAVTCASTDLDRIDVMAFDAADPRGMAWIDRVQAGDSIVLRRVDETNTYQGHEHRAVVTSTGSGGPCNSALAAVAPADLRRVRLTFQPVSPTALTIGAPALVKRSVRLSLYRSGALWYLGRRSRVRGAWETVQPLAGPFLSPAQRGMRTALLNHAGGRVLADTASIRISLRATRMADGRTIPTVDSAVLDIALRGQRAP